MRTILKLFGILSLVNCTSPKSNAPERDSTSQVVVSEKTIPAQSETSLENEDNNLWNYRNRFTIRLPIGFFFSSSIIYNSDSMKVGEIVIDFENVVQDFAAKDFLSMQDWDSKIVTDETEYHTSCEDCTLIKADSLFDGAREWYYTIEQADYEGADGEYGTWSAFQFICMENGKVILLTFYRKELKDLKVDPYVEILKTIRPV